MGFVPEALNQAAYHNSPDHYAKGTPSPVTKVIGLRPLVGAWFQVHIPPLTGVLLTIHSRYWFTIGRRRVFSLTGWSPQIQPRFHVTGPTQVPIRCVNAFAYGAVTLCGGPFQNLPLAPHSPMFRSYNPERETLSVWAIPLSLAATDGIDFSFSSSGYLDVSVHRVVTKSPMDSVTGNRAPRDHSLFVSYPELFADFHALHSFDAKASPIRPS